MENRTMKTFLSALVVTVFMSAGSLYAQEKAALGVTMSDNSAGGVLISTVVPNSPAAHIGLQSGDRILAINGQPTANYRDVSRIIDASRRNAAVQLTVVRGTWRGNLTGALGSAATVFNPAAPYVPASRPAYTGYPLDQGWGPFPRDWIDNGSRGVAASYGGGGW
jgi:membrane-associated protease RseP (regulator of RpoE activity)